MDFLNSSNLRYQYLMGEIYKLFNRDPKCIYYIREFDVIQDDRVIKGRLEEVYVHMGMKMPRNIKLEYYFLT